MNDTPALRDERIVSVENSSYRLGYGLLIFGLLALVVLRIFRWPERNLADNLDIVALILVSSLTTIAYQGYHKIVNPRRWTFIFLCVVCLVLLAVLGGLLFLIIPG